jgi:hypothetical protein
MTLRIGARAVTREPAAANNAGAYLERLVKLVPMEVIGAYPLLVQGADAAGAWSKPLLSWILLGLVILIRAKTTATISSGPQWTAVWISAISFLIWVYVMGGDFGLLLLVDAFGMKTSSIEPVIAYYRNIALVVWTIVVPLFYKGDTHKID